MVKMAKNNEHKECLNTRFTLLNLLYGTVKIKLLKGYDYVTSSYNNHKVTGSNTVVLINNIHA